MKHKGLIIGGTGLATLIASCIIGKRYFIQAQKDIQRNSRPIEPVDENDVGFEDYGHLKTFDIDKGRRISVLITGAGSYIGESFKSYCSQYYPNITVAIIDMVDNSWKSHSFCTEDGRPFDTVFHVAGIAHSEVGKASVAEQENYYRVNTDLAIETAKKCRDAGVRQFIFMSSMIVYGGKEFIGPHTIPKPSNFYGNSKWLGDKGVRALSFEGKNGNPEFAVAVLRPPMIYGKGSKGNYPTLSRLAKMLLLFPRVSNTRSMLYIENLCEFVSLLALSGAGGVYFPQNREYSNTSELVREMGTINGRTVKLSKALTPVVWISEHAPNKRIRDLASKAFGSSYYDQGMSEYAGLDYQKISLEESIRRTEG